jgi:hypothetical protein
MTLRSPAIGSRGPAGPQGPKGDVGPAGAQGAPGPAGAKGDTGAAGAAGPKGDTGALGAQGVKGDTGATGAQGAIGQTGPQGAKGDTGAQGATGATGPAGPQGAKGDTGATGATGPAGSSASATPLGTSTPKALGTATPGTATSAAREDHVHPLPVGRLELLGTLLVSETLLVSLSVGMKRKDVAITLPQGAAALSATDKLLAIPNGAPTTGCEVVNAYPGTGPSAGLVSIGYYTPLLAIGATYSIPVAVYRITT